MKNKELPENLYYESRYNRYRYKNPINGKKYTLDNNKEIAIKQTHLLNERLIKNHIILIDSSIVKLTLGQFLETFKKDILPNQGLSKNTLKDYSQKITIINQQLGHYLIDDINVFLISHFLAAIPSVNSNRYRSLLIQIFRHGKARGICTNNPAADTIPNKEIVQRNRLTLNEFKLIHAQSECWFKGAMELALQTLQRRGDLVRLKWQDIQDGYLHVRQQKVERHGTGLIKIKVSGKLETLLDRIHSTIDFDNPFILQRGKRYKNAQKMLPSEDLSRFFHDARERTNLYSHLSPNEKPTFHEIRSLGIKIYRENGLSDEQIRALSGHATDEMYQLYLKRHVQQWICADVLGIDL